MKVGWLADCPNYVGGAERTQAEFRVKAPEGVEVVDCLPGEVVRGLDRYVIHNCMTYREEDFRRVSAPIFRYHNDTNARMGTGRAIRHIFCSPLQQKRMGMEGECIPPALDLKQLHQVRQAQELMGDERKGAVWLGMHPNHPGKGVDLALEWASGNGGLDVYGNGSPNGLVPAEDVPRLLARYKTFVHLPRALEPFGRSVVEAWVLGLELIINRNIGARHYIEENARALETAAEDFWRVVLNDHR